MRAEIATMGECVGDRIAVLRADRPKTVTGIVVTYVTAVIALMKPLP